MYKGKILAGFAAFKAHAAFGFWAGSQILETGARQESAMGQFGRLTSLDDLPPRAELEALTEKAMALIDEGVKPVRNKHAKPPFTVPQDLRAAIDAVPAAAATFDNFAAVLPARICRMGHRGQARRNPRQAPRPDGRVARRRQEAQLEIRELLSRGRGPRP